MRLFTLTRSAETRSGSGFSPDLKFPPLQLILEEKLFPVTTIKIKNIYIYLCPSAQPSSGGIGSGEEHLCAPKRQTWTARGARTGPVVMSDEARLNPAMSTFSTEPALRCISRFLDRKPQDGSDSSDPGSGISQTGGRGHPGRQQVTLS